MECEWDLAKARSNFKKHGIRFADAVIALEDDAAVTIVDSNDQEERSVSMRRDAYWWLSTPGAKTGCA